MDGGAPGAPPPPVGWGGVVGVHVSDIPEGFLKESSRNPSRNPEKSSRIPQGFLNDFSRVPLSFLENPRGILKKSSRSS